jgi:hypothetical protein
MLLECLMGEFLAPEVAKNDKTMHQQTCTSDAVHQRMRRGDVNCEG